ncbi:endoribonuclease ysh1 [Coemansia sp. RSA 562]|nr:endoribonuclease ysh1 [Coemansia sp. RSA 562]
MSDMAADSVVAVVLNIESCPASVKLTQGRGCGHSHHSTSGIDETVPAGDGPHSHSHAECTAVAPGLARTNDNHEIATKLALFLQQQFSRVEVADDGSSITVHLNDLSAVIDADSLDIQTESPMLRARVEPLVAQVSRALRPLSHRSVALPEPEPATPLASGPEPEHKGDAGADADDTDSSDDDQTEPPTSANTAASPGHE